MLPVGRDSNYHEQANPRLRQSTDDEAMTAKVTNVELDVMRLEIQEVGSDEVRMKIEMMKETRWNVLRIKLKCGLVCELTLRVNRPLQRSRVTIKSPLCILAFSMGHRIIFYDT